MGRVHDVLRWANRTDVAEEVTRRGYRVSGETLNRWVREKREFPAIVERIVFDLFTIGQQETPPSEWTEALQRMEGKIDKIPTREYADGVGIAAANQVITAVEKMLLGDAKKPGSVVGRLATELEDQLRRSGLLHGAGSDEESTEPPGNAGTGQRRSA